MMINTTPDFSLEQQHAAPVAGIDEAGCGPWAGPVVAAAVIFLSACDDCNWLTLIRDSKQLSAKQRAKLYEHMIDDPEHIIYGIGRSEVEEIDALNIAQATGLAMRRAIANLSLIPASALVDGIRNPNLNVPTTLVVKGDQRSLSIAAASILAKVTRDQYMQKLDEEFPMYGWKHNAGYGTVQHQCALQDHGVSLHHRKSFSPIARLLKS